MRADWQKIAAATALLRRLCIISEGPGTGKTTMVVKVLALLLGLILRYAWRSRPNAARRGREHRPDFDGAELILVGGAALSDAVVWLEQDIATPKAARSGRRSSVSGREMPKRCLCAVREGKQGTTPLNALLTERFRGALGGPRR